MDEDAVQNQELSEDDLEVDQSEEMTTEEEQSTQVIITPEMVKDYLRNNPDALTDEDVYSIPTVRTRMDRTISKQYEELRKKAQREQEEATQRKQLAVRARTYVDQIDHADAATLKQWGLENPNLWSEYQRAQEVLADPDDRLRTRVLTETHRGIISKFQQEHPDVNFDQASDIPELIKMAKDVEVQKALAEMTQKFDAQFESLRRELTGKQVAEEEQPEPQPSTTTRFEPQSFEDIEDKYARGVVTYAVYRDALAKRR